MKKYNLYLRKAITLKSLKKNIKTMLNKIDLGQYISIQTKVMLNGNLVSSCSLGRKYYLDLKNKDDKEFYLAYLMEKFNTNYINQNNPDKVTGICFYCVKSNENNYAKFIYKLNQIDFLL